MVATIECINPILPVRDMKASLDYYQKALGFQRADWVADDAAFAGVARDGCVIYLAAAPDPSAKGTAWIGVEDIGPLHDEYRTSGASIRRPPTNFSWAYEMVVEDLDGNVLRIGSEPRQDMPFND